jgi:hypothetical protein
MMSSENGKIHPHFDRDKPLDGKLLYISPNFYVCVLRLVGSLGILVGYLVGSSLILRIMVLIFT